MPRRAVTADAATPSSASTLAEFEAWMRGAGIRWDAAAVALVAGAAGCGGAAVGVHALADIPPGAQLCSIPKSACLTPLTTSIADLLQREQLGGGLALTVALAHERSLGAASAWHGYLRSLPPREYLPMFWTPQEVALLEGSELEGRAAAEAADVADDYAAHVAPALARHPARLRAAGLTREHYAAAASLVASRAFGVDSSHGEGMVPLADAFNHKAAAVALSAAYAVHGASSSDEEEEEEEKGSAEGDEEEEEEEEEDASGSDEGGEHAASAEGEEGAAPDEDEADDDDEEDDEDWAAALAEGVLRPGGAPPSFLGVTSANGLHLALEMAIVERRGALVVVAPSAVAAGAEVHNTYGELGNAALVHKYGFALRDNPFTAVTLDKGAVVAACGAQHAGADAAAPGKRRRAGGGGGGEAARLLRVLQEESDLLEEEEEPFEVLANGHLGPALFAALRVLCSGAGAVGGPAARSLGEALAAPGAEGGRGGVDPGPGRIGAVRVAPEAGAEGEAGLSGMVTAPMCRALLAARAARRARYPADLQATLAELEKLEPGKAGKSGKAGKGSKAAAALNEVPSEGEVARRAALTLRASELEVLAAAAEAAERRLAGLERRQGGGGAAGGKAAGAKAPKRTRKG
jgi:SET domain-containing protein 6